MAKATIIGGAHPYYTINVECSGGREFVQQIYCEKEGEDLERLLQSYADDYEAALSPVEGE